MKQPKNLNVALGAIELGPNHRTKFDDQKLQELADSITQVGILQPIILRTIEGKNDGYILVSGERRYRAAMMVYEKDNTKLTIPATVHANLSDEDALEIQITENLQRVDVHPMEEGLAFKQLMVSKSYQLTEIAKRFGKSAAFVGQRIKLTDLIGPIQSLFSSDRINLTLALQMCKFSQEIQTEVYDKEMKKQDGQIVLNTWQLNKYLGNLAHAAFDLTDILLNKTMGACSTCVHNSATVGSLFPEEVKNSRCMLVSCFQKKVKTHYDRELKAAITEGTIALVTTEYGRNNHQSDVLKGHKIYNQNDYDDARRPDMPNITEFEDQLENHEYKNRDEMQAALDKAQESYEKQLKKYKKKIESGQYIKAFVISGDSAGKYIYVAIKKSDSTAGAKPGELTAANIDAEISRLQQREERNKELDEEKTMPKIHDLLNPLNVEFYIENPKDRITGGHEEHLHDVEVRALVYLLFNYMGWTYKDDFYKSIGLDEDISEMEFYQHLCEQKTIKLYEYVNILTRQNIVDKFTPKKGQMSSDDPEIQCLIDVATLFNPDGVKAIMDEQTEIATKRSERVNKKIKDLKEAKKKPAGDTAQDSAAPGKKRAAKQTT